MRSTQNAVTFLLGHPLRNSAAQQAALEGKPFENNRDAALHEVGCEMCFYTDRAWALLTDEQQRELSNGIHQAAMLALKDPDQKGLRAWIRNNVEKLAAEVIEVMTPQIRERIEAEVNARWESQVEQIVAAKVAAALAKVKAEIAR